MSNAEVTQTVVDADDGDTEMTDVHDSIPSEDAYMADVAAERERKIAEVKRKRKQRFGIPISKRMKTSAPEDSSDNNFS